jgi:pyrroline-5-carboxylate reductase
MRLAIVGIGNLGGALAEMLLTAGFCRDDMSLIVRNSGAAAERCSRLGVTPQGLEGVRDADLVVLTVKPQDTAAVCAQLRSIISEETLVVSMMAGVSCASLGELLGHKAIVRAMPNLGAVVGQSATVYYVPSSCSETQRTCVERILRACGQAYQVDSEDLLDVATAVAGSGPAYLCWLGEQIEQVAVSEGFSEADAHAIVLQTFKGAVAYLEHGHEKFSDMRSRVTSPNGTTAAALRILSESNSGDSMRAAIRAALERSRELGRARQ